MRIIQLLDKTATPFGKMDVPMILSSCDFDYESSRYNKQVLFRNRESGQYTYLNYDDVLNEKGNWWFAAYNVGMTFKYEETIITVSVKGERDIPGTAGEKSRGISGVFTLNLGDNTLNIIENW